MQWDTVVLGAGVAGLAAARRLAEAGRRVVVLEASSRAGGRMRTVDLPGLGRAVELGAEFVHGRPPELLSLLEEAGLALTENEGEFLCYDGGRVGRCQEAAEPWRLLDGMEAAAAAHGDMTFDQYLARTGATAAQSQRARSYIEGFNAADASVIGIKGLAFQQAAEEEIEGARAAVVDRGYGVLAAWMQEKAHEAGAAFAFDTQVEAVTWRRGSCAVHTADGRRSEARQVICTLPLGVLQSGGVRFDPLPQEAFRALRELRAGTAARMVLVFREAWWLPRYSEMRFLFATDLFPPTWWTSAPRDSPILTAWVAGPRAEAVRSREEFLAAALATLRQMFGDDVASLLEGAYFHDWARDPWTQGAYSWAPAGAADASRTLARPVQQTLFFAGEHTDITGHPGTVHGALRSGLRAAAQVLQAK